MPCDLHRLYGELACALPDDPDGDGEFVFHVGNLPAPSAKLSTDRLVIQRSAHNYDGWYNVDALWISLGPRTAREFAVFLLAAAFHGPCEETTLTLTHRDSDIRRIRIAPETRDLIAVPPGLLTVPFSFRYLPECPRKHPWTHVRDVGSLPLMALTDEDLSVRTIMTRTNERRCA